MPGAARGTLVPNIGMDAEGHRDVVNLESTAAELYGLAPGDFVAARTAAEKQARAAGDRELAGQIHALAKPTAAAWIANQLVREHAEEIAGLRELGAGLREATAGLEGEQLRQLSQQQNRVIAALVGQARSLATSAGQPMSEATERGLEATLRAALADEDLADQLGAGRLPSRWNTWVSAGRSPPMPYPNRRRLLATRRAGRAAPPSRAGRAGPSESARSPRG